MMDLINPLLNAVTSLHGEALVIFFLVVNGYMWKMVPSFPNRWIPLINMLLGPLLCVAVVKWPDPADTWMQQVKYAELAAWANTLMQGVALSFVAWVLHHKILKTLIDDKVPAMNPGMTKETKETVETSVAADGGATKTIGKEEKTVLETPPNPEPKV